MRKYICSCEFFLIICRFLAIKIQTNIALFTSDLLAEFLLVHHDNCTIIENCKIKDYLYHKIFNTSNTTKPKTFLKIVKVKIRFVQGREGLFTIGHISKPRPERDSSSNQPMPPLRNFVLRDFHLFSLIGHRLSLNVFPDWGICQESERYLTKSSLLPRKFKSKFQSARTLTKRSLLLPEN